MQGAARDFCGVNDTSGDEIFEFLRHDVKADVWVLFGANSLDNDRAFFARIGDDLPQGFFQRALDYVDADLLVASAINFPMIWSPLAEIAPT